MPSLLPSFRRKRARDKLQSILSIADDEAFCRMVWAASFLQGHDVDIARSYLVFPEEAVNADISSPYRLHPWTLETLINELFTTPKYLGVWNGRYRSLNCEQFEALTLAINALNALEDAEAELWLREDNVLIEMHRIAQRQFHWQRGFLNTPQFFRSATLYNFPESNDFFREKYGLTVTEFMQCGFAIYVWLCKNPFLQASANISFANISNEKIEKTLSLVSMKIFSAREHTRNLRNVYGHTAYKPSLLRQNPVIFFSGRGYAPLRELIIERVTSGIFYDLQPFSGSLRNKVAAKFEVYCKELIERMIPEVKVFPEISYQNDRNRTPDLLLCQDEKIFAVAECKSTKMIFKAKFSEQPLEDAAQGYGEIEKAIIQIWRFFSHHRLGLLPLEQPISPDAVGIALTLDSWGEMFGMMRAQLIERANSRVDREEPSIILEDRRPIVFCPISDLEFLLTVASPDSLVSTLRAAVEKDYHGFLLSSLHERLFGNPSNRKRYAFADELSSVLPWWGNSQ